jgi:spermidine synthase
MPHRVPRPAVYAAFLLSGLTALVYQIIWSRYLTLLVGGTSAAHTIVLATFMGGLAFGNAYFGRLADRPGINRLRTYALLELGIGLSCLLFPILFERVSQLYLTLAAWKGPGAPFNTVLKVALSAVSMFVPCALMGGTLPVLAKYVVDRMSDMGVKIGWLYFINTAGAVFGCLLGGFYVIEHWGLEAGMVAGALANIAIGGLFYVWSRRVPAAPPETEAEKAEAAAAAVGEPVYSLVQARVAFWCIAIAGGISLLYELAWTRVLSMSMGGTVHSFSTMLVSFISGIALGSAIVGRLLRRPRNALALFGLCEVGIALCILLPLRAYERLPYVFHKVGYALSHSPETYGLFMFSQVALAAVVMLVPTTLIGAALPLASRVCVDSLDVLGRRVGGVFSANTVGTVIGATLTGFVLLPRLGLERTLLLGGVLSGTLGVALLWAWRPRGTESPVRALGAVMRPAAAGAAARLWPVAAILLGACALLALVRPRWDPRLMQAGLFRWERKETFPSWAAFQHFATQSRFLYVRDGADGTIAVQERSPLDRGVRVNGKVDASVFDMPTQLMVGHLPMMLHPDPRRAMVVGLGCGATAAAVVKHPGVTVDVAEISPEMVEAAAFFEPWTGNVLSNPRMSLHVLDAREFLLLTRDSYDVIVSEPTNVWIPGVANLFTREFYQVVRSRLKPGGLFAQWIQVYAAEQGMVASVVATLRTEFPYVSAWLINEGDLILLAADERPRLDPQAFAERLARLDAATGIPSPPRAALAMFMHPILFLSNQIGTAQGVGVAFPAGSGHVLRDLRPRLEFDAARAQYVAQHYAVRTELDERMRPLGAEPLFVADYLARYPLDDGGRLALSNLYREMGGSYADLRAALAASLVLGGRNEASLLPMLPDSLLANIVVAGRLGQAIDGGVAELDLCDAYLRAEHAVLREARTMFGRPATEHVERRYDRCVTALPEATQRLSAILVKALADGGAIEPALRRIRQMDESGVLVRLERREAASLLVAGSLLLLESARRDEAFPFAQRALAMDPFNAAAARLVAALGPRAAPLAQARAAAAPPRPQ